MFDLRYHVASLAAVFLALVIGILVGVGISDPVDNARTGLLEREVAKLQSQLDQRAQQSTDQVRERAAAQRFMSETYPVLVRNRLRGKQIVVLFVGPADGGVRSAVSDALADSGARQLRLRALKVPIDPKQLDVALASEPASGSLVGPDRLDALGRALGEELVLGGETPLWDVLTDVLVQEVAGHDTRAADGVVVVRTVSPQRAATSRFLLGLYSGLTTVDDVPAIGVETTDAADSATAVFRQAGLSTVDDVDTRVGRFALVLLLAGAPSGQYGVKESADDPLPPLPTAGASGG
jgi:copper transport outer membrane protein MctB